MLIPDELAQRIVDTTQCLAHRNINIMNRDGIIIGTTQTHRRRTFHKGAKDVVETSSAVEIYTDELALYPGALPGVNLPVVLDGHIVGVVGVTGEPEEVRGTAGMIKAITELFLEREVLQKEARSRVRLSEHLVELLLWQYSETNEGSIRRTAKALGFALDQPRVAAVGDISTLLAKYRERYGSSELVLERAHEWLLQQLSATRAVDSQDLAAVTDNRLILLRKWEGVNPRQNLDEWSRSLTAACQDLPPGLLRFGVGAATRNLAEYSLSWRQAEFCLRAATSQAPFRTVYDRDLCVGYLLQEALSGAGGMVLRPLQEALGELIRRKPEAAITLRALLDHNGEIDATSGALGIHRNTLVYRLDRIREALHLDPVHRLEDAVLLRILLGEITDPPSPGSP